VVGWSLSPVNDRHLTIAALKRALLQTRPGTDLLHHSDQGSTYASEDYQDILAERGITCSMSRTGEVLDNAAMEAWNSTRSSAASGSRQRDRGGEDVRVHRTVLQSAATSLGHRDGESGRVREAVHGKAGGVLKLSAEPEAVSSDRRNTSAMMSALRAEVMGWGIESIMGIG
jgi:transposase InsO family protein